MRVGRRLFTETRRGPGFETSSQHYGVCTAPSTRHRHGGSRQHSSFVWRQRQRRRQGAQQAAARACGRNLKRRRVLVAQAILEAEAPRQGPRGPKARIFQPAFDWQDLWTTSPRMSSAVVTTYGREVFHPPRLTDEAVPVPHEWQGGQQQHHSAARERWRLGAHRRHMV